MRLVALVTLSLVSCKADARDPPHAVRLPKSSATPALTLCHATPATIARLAAIAHLDFDRADLGTTAGELRVRQTTQTRPKLGVTVELGACNPACPGLASPLPDRLRDRPDTRIARGTLTDPRFARPFETRYALGASDGSSAQKDPQADAELGGTYIDAYTLYAEDGAAWLRVTANYRDDAVGGVDRLLAIAPPEDLQKLATAFASFYLYECRSSD